jgi:ABC-type glycerol-3-phosphate transport system permease component
MAPPYHHQHIQGGGPRVIGEFVTQFSTNFKGMSAAAVVTTALPMALLLLLQRYFTQTVSGAGGW